MTFPRLRLPQGADPWDALGIAAFAALIRSAWLLGSLPLGPSAGRGEAWAEVLAGVLVLAAYVKHELALAAPKDRQGEEVEG